MLTLGNPFVYTLSLVFFATGFLLAASQFVRLCRYQKRTEPELVVEQRGTLAWMASSFAGTNITVVGWHMSLNLVWLGIAVVMIFYFVRRVVRNWVF